MREHMPLFILMAVTVIIVTAFLLFPAYQKLELAKDLEWETLLAGFAGLAGGVLAVFKISDQINSSEAIERQRQLQSELAALIKLKKGAEDWRHFFNDNDAAIDLYLGDLADAQEEVNFNGLRDYIWQYHPPIFQAITDLTRPVPIDVQLGVMAFQQRAEAVDRLFNRIGTDEDGIFDYWELIPDLVRNWRAMETALASLEGAYQRRLREIDSDYDWQFVEPNLYIFP